MQTATIVYRKDRSASFDKRRRRRQKHLLKTTKQKEEWRKAKEKKQTTFYRLCQLLEDRVKVKLAKDRHITYDCVHKSWKSSYHEGKGVMSTIWRAITWFNENRQYKYNAYAFYDEDKRQIRFRKN